MDERAMQQRSEDEPDQGEIESMQVDEELEFVRIENVPDDVKSEVLERLDRYHDADLENETPEGTHIE